MTIIKWRESYETGVAEMDAEHKELIDIINQLYQMQREKKSYEELQDVFNRLVRYTENHFSHEERLMEQTKYGEVEQQKAAHQKFIEELKEMEPDLVSGREDAAPVVNKFLREWWLNHIVGMDKEYGPHLQNNQ